MSTRAAGTFDVVIGHVSMPYMNTRAAFREVYRVLSPGGSFLLTFHSFYFVHQWLLEDIRTAHWKGIPYKIYIATNGVLNHLNLPQAQVWWKPSAFETVNTPRGIRLAAEMAGFTDVVSHPRPNRILFDATARKPSADGPMMPPPEAIYPAT
jgi:SAM-dependent methyltransferase